jgi:hypothetical protein
MIMMCTMATGISAASCGRTPRQQIADGSGRSWRAAPQLPYDRGYPASREQAMADFKAARERDA